MHTRDREIVAMKMVMCAQGGLVMRCRGGLFDGVIIREGCVATTSSKWRTTTVIREGCVGQSSCRSALRRRAGRRQQPASPCLSAGETLCCNPLHPQQVYQQLRRERASAK